MSPAERPRKGKTVTVCVQERHITTRWHKSGRLRSAERGAAAAQRHSRSSQERPFTMRHRCSARAGMLSLMLGVQTVSNALASRGHVPAVALVPRCEHRPQSQIS